MVSENRVQEYEERIQSMSPAKVTKRIEWIGGSEIKEIKRRCANGVKSELWNRIYVRREWRVKKRQQELLNILKRRGCSRWRAWIQNGERASVQREGECVCVESGLTRQGVDGWKGKSVNVWRAKALHGAVGKSIF